MDNDTVSLSGLDNPTRLSIREKRKEKETRSISGRIRDARRSQHLFFRNAQVGLTNRCLASHRFEISFHERTTFAFATAPAKKKTRMRDVRPLSRFD